MLGLQEKDSVQYITVLGSTGDFRMSVPEGTEGAKYREYETSDGKTGGKWEKVYKSIGGKIIGVEFFEGDYGKNLIVTFDVGEGDPVKVSLSTNTPFGEDVMKKIQNINLEENVVFSPYAFEDDKGKLRKGISITQGDEKIMNYYYDPEKKKNLHKYPEPEGDTKEFDKDDWKIYFTKVRKFLVAEVEKNVIPNIPAHTPAEPQEEEQV